MPVPTPPPERIPPPSNVPPATDEVSTSIAKMVKDGLLSMNPGQWIRLSGLPLPSAQDLARLGLPEFNLTGGQDAHPDGGPLEPVSFVSDDDKPVVKTGDSFEHDGRTVKLLGHDGYTYALVDKPTKGDQSTVAKPGSVEISSQVTVGKTKYYIGDDEKAYVEGSKKGEYVLAHGVEVVALENLPVTVGDAEEEIPIPPPREKTEGKKTETKKLKFGEAFDYHGKTAKLLAYDTVGVLGLLELPKESGAKTEKIKVTADELNQKFESITHNDKTYYADEKGKVYQESSTKGELELVPHLHAARVSELEKMNFELPEFVWVHPDTPKKPAWEPVEKTETVKGKKVKVKADTADDRVYSVDGKETSLRRQGGWYGRDGFKDKQGHWINQHADIKLHITTTGPQDMRDMQAVLIPALEKATQPGGPLEGKVAVYKTHDPMTPFDDKWTERLPHLADTPSKDHLRPAATGQGAKGFVVYPATEADVQAVHDFCVKTLKEAGLGLSEAPNTGNHTDGSADKTTHRVKIDRDMFEHSKEGSPSGAVVPEELAKGIKDYCEKRVKEGAKGWEEFKSTADLYENGKLKPKALERVLVEQKVDPKLCGLTYEEGEGGRLIFTSNEHEGKNSKKVTLDPYRGIVRFYLSEANAVSKPTVGERGELIKGMTGRPAFYALGRGVGAVVGRELDPGKMALREANEKRETTERTSVPPALVNPLVQLDLQNLARKGITAEKLTATMKQVSEVAKAGNITGVNANVPAEQARDLATILLSEKLEPTAENIATAEQKRKQIEQLRKQYPDSEICVTNALDLMAMEARNSDIFKQAFANKEFVETTAQALAESVLKPGSDFETERNPTRKLEHLRKALVDVLKDQLNLSPEEVPDLLKKLKIEAVAEGTGAKLVQGKEGPVIQIPTELLSRDPAAAVRDAFGQAAGVTMLGILGLPGNIRHVQQALKPIIDQVIARAEPEIRAKQTAMLEDAGKPARAVATESKPDTLGRPEPVTVVWEGGDTIVWGKDQKLALTKESEELKKRKQQELNGLKEELAQLEKDKERNSEAIRAMKQTIAAVEQDVALLHNLNEGLSGKYGDKAQETARGLVKEAIDRALKNKGEEPLAHGKPGAMSRTSAITLVLTAMAGTFAAKYGMGREGKRFSSTFGGT